MLRRHAAIAALLLVAAPSARAQSAPPRPATLDSSLVAAFSGRWSCAGAFASGRPIASDVTLTSELDGRALLLRHDDRAPSRWRALAMWMADSGGTVRATLYDNGSPAPRVFVATPWDGKSFALVSQPASGAAPSARRERFTYVAPSRDSIGFAYEVSQDGSRWALGDRLACGRR